jgi:hypothetical protein
LANLPKLGNEKIDTRKELSKLANVGERTYGKAVDILHNNNEEVKQKVLSGNMSINAGGLNLTLPYIYSNVMF